MSKHTLGPWHLSIPDDTIVVSTTGKDIATMSGDYEDADQWPVMEANARLIAAAPELLDLVKILADVAEEAGHNWDTDAETCPGCDALQRVRALIHRIKGDAT